MYMITFSPRSLSLAIDVEIESTDTAVRQCTQALIDCGVIGCFINVEWVQSNNVPARPLTNPIPVYNVDGTANKAGMIVEIEDMMFAVTHLGKQSMILGYNWLHNHNPEINWQTKDSRCLTAPPSAPPATSKPKVRQSLTRR
jgi:hypothetical protein